MKIWSFFDQSSGIFLEQHFQGREEHLEVNTPPGAAAIEGRHDAMAVMVDLATGSVVRRSVAPSGNENREAVWQPEQARWAWRPTVLARATRVREERDRLLLDADKVTLRSYDRNERVPKAWTDYKQALRDVPSQPGFPDEVTWPQPPP